MFVEKDFYFEVKELKEKGLKAIYTKKDFCDVKLDSDRKKILELLGISQKKIYSGFQTHSSNITIIKKDTSQYLEDTDGFLTDRDDVVIFTKYADCLPIYFYDKINKAYGCVHSGWMGSFKKIGENAIKILETNFHSKLENIIVVFGIGISIQNYEVSQEFYEKFKKEFSENLLKDVFVKKEKKYYFDNQKFNYNLMINCGIKKENIISNTLCTFDGNFHSYRREKESSGRNGAYIFIDN
ncbi:peptidoglycan editing factor PgeF [Cetobacterium sp.]|uniref:peptidoglycan editing factor PgeF n=1 Tax=Cetobacterium sp. TaxID=2071632 RepID=UPI003F2ACE2E